MKSSIIFRVLKKGNFSAIAEARASVKVEHTIIYEGEVIGCTIDLSAFGGTDDFYTDAYIILGTKFHV